MCIDLKKFKSFCQVTIPCYHIVSCYFMDTLKPNDISYGGMYEATTYRNNLMKFITALSVGSSLV